MEHTDLELYIKIKDGQPFEHPILADNFYEVFSHVDVDNLPTDQFAKFIRVSRPKLKIYELFENNEPSYEWVDGVVKDVWKIRPMTDEEKAAKQQKVKDEWAARPQAENWAAWTFDEATCKYIPPIPRPEPDNAKISQRIFTYWSGADNNWKDAPPFPVEEGKSYKFDFLAWEWVSR